jgi:hypothetical protein
VTKRDYNNDGSYADICSGVSFGKYELQQNGQVLTATEPGLVVYDVVTGVEKLPGMPAEFKLSQNYPNPFNPTTKIQFSVPKTAKVSLEVFDVLGRRVATIAEGEKPAGTYEADFNGANLASGIYFCTMTAKSGTETFSKTTKMVLAK